MQAQTANLEATNWFIPIADAAPFIGWHPNALARLCRESLALRGMAKLVKPADGGQAQWFIARDFNPKLQTPEQKARNTPSDLSQFTQRQREQAMQRLWCVEQLHAARRSERGTMKAAEAEIIALAKERYPELRISRSRLYAWDSNYNYPRDLIKLVDQRGGDRKHPADPAAWQAFRDLYLHENQPSIRQCHLEVKRLARERGWSWCSYDACARQLDGRIPPQDQLRYRDPAAYRNQLTPFISQHPESWRAGELYIGDHKQLDLICQGAGGILRPWLTAWMDWRSRKIVGWVLSESPNSTTILGALRHAIKDPENMGGPDAVWIDNGRDYDAWLFHGQSKRERRSRIKVAVDEPKTLGVFNLLKIEAHFAIAFNPKGKARLERWFRTLESFFKTFDTYTGEGIDTKPERLNEILKNRALVPTFETVYERLAQHISGYNANADHSIEDLEDGGDRLSPADAFARWCDRKRVLADPSALDLLLQHWHKPVTVGRNGISLQIGSRALHYGQFEHALTPFKALKKSDRRPLHISFDPHCLNTIRVYDEQFRFVCDAELNQLGGFGGRVSKEHVAMVSRNKAAYERAENHVAEHCLTQTLSPAERLAEVALSDKPRPIHHQEPSSIKIVRTPLEGAAKEIGREQLRKAVGAESLSESDARPIKMALKPLSQIFANAARTRRDDEPKLLSDPWAKLRERQNER